MSYWESKSQLSSREETRLAVEELKKNMKRIENLLVRAQNYKAEYLAKRQKYTTVFDNYDQKSNQLFNIISTILKNQKEMEAGITRNLQ